MTSSFSPQRLKMGTGFQPSMKHKQSRLIILLMSGTCFVSCYMYGQIKQVTFCQNIWNNLTAYYFTLSFTSFATHRTPLFSQHSLACFQRFPIKQASFVLRKHYTMALHSCTKHLNLWAYWPFFLVAWGVRSKNTYISEFDKCSDHS